ncbi:MAG: metal-dependent transcriptional regulator [Candidatus Heimdallarchaeota archaeon]|nr:metal-dependent transcriptional regulator [Candidatus Heimdallarchaeota archaeon]
MSNFKETLELTFNEKETMRYFLQLEYEKKNKIIKATELTDIIDFSRPRAYAVLSKLEEKKIVDKVGRKGFQLTEFGNEVLMEFEHRFKILETYFHDELNMELEMAMHEASALVLHVSYDFIKILCNKMDRPKFCPHNLEIHHPT